LVTDFCVYEGSETCVLGLTSFWATLTFVTESFALESGNFCAFWIWT
jgi:hypothetical protein